MKIKKDTITEAHLYSLFNLEKNNNIWNDIVKPEKYRDSSPRDFFKFEFITLPHKKYKEQEFENEIKEMRKRLHSGHEAYIFDHIKAEKNVPADGIKSYYEQIWKDILNEKDLDIVKYINIALSEGNAC